MHRLVPTPFLRAAWVALAAVTVLAPPADAQTRGSASDDVVIYLVRHGEVDADGTRDPSLSAGGRERARLLAGMLRDAGITHVHSTDLHRTQQTGGPFSEAAGLEIASYDPGDLPGFADRLRAVPGRHLVLGHSNTTPALVAALGGDAGTPIDEFEFDRLYVLTTTAAGGVRTILLRYGAPFRP